MSREKFRRGFKTQAEQLARETRAELGLGLHDRLDPRRLAEHLAIEVVSLSSMRRLGARDESVSHFLQGSGRTDFSAATVFVGTVRVIVENDGHADARRANSVAHELSHVLLEHEPHSVTGNDGTRRWLPQMEDEADWVAGTLLVPREAALAIARNGTPVVQAASLFGVSTELLTWRLNHTGATIQARREAGRRRWQA